MEKKKEISQHSGGEPGDSPPNTVVKPGFYRFLATSNPPRAPNPEERQVINRSISEHLAPLGTEAGIGRDGYLVLCEDILGQYMASVNPRLMPALAETGRPDVEVNQVTFTALPTLNLDTTSIPIWFVVKQLAAADSFIDTASGQSHDAPNIAKAVARKMGGTVAFWLRTDAKVCPDAPQVGVGHVGLRFAVLVPPTATLVKGTFEDNLVDFERHSGFRACAHCHSMAHRRSECPTAPLCTKCQANTTHAPRFCDQFAKAEKAQAPSPMVAPTQRPFQPAAHHSKRKRRTAVAKEAKQRPSKGAPKSAATPVSKTGHSRTAVSNPQPSKVAPTTTTTTTTTAAANSVPEAPLAQSSQASIYEDARDDINDCSTMSLNVLPAVPSSPVHANAPVRETRSSTSKARSLISKCLNPWGGENTSDTSWTPTDDDDGDQSFDVSQN